MAGTRGSVVVVGGGISGIQCALDLAGSGFKVIVVDQNPTPGGIVGQLEKTFPTHDCAFCLLEPKLIDLVTHGDVEVAPSSEVSSVKGKKGDFKVTIRGLKRYIDPMKCSDCGACFEQCDHISRFYAPLAARLSSMKDVLDAVHHVYVVDQERCDHCGDCEKVCKEGAVVFNETPEERTVDAAAVVLAPGFRPFDPRGMKEYGYGTVKDVITSIDLERLMSAPGERSSIVTRPSDGTVPKKVAFLQCVGSRDERTNTYCSSLCCMAALKEAIILVERYRMEAPTIFFMDIRSFGKEYEDYYNIAREEYKVNFVNSRAATVEEDVDVGGGGDGGGGERGGGAIVRFVDEAGRPRTERFDMVVLSVGLVSPMGARALAEGASVELNEHGFLRTSRFDPLTSSVDGIYGCGAFLAPKDIPDAVCDASGAALLATIGYGKGGQEGKKEDGKAAVSMEDGPPKVGVLICRCGDEISKVVDTGALAEFAKGLPDVAHVEVADGLCTPEGRAAIGAVVGKGVNRMVLAGCSPRVLDPLAMGALREVGLNPFLSEVANIREHVAWVHYDDAARANGKARSLVRMAVSKVREDLPLPLVDLEVNKACLVLGGGLSGMTAAKALADVGFKVDIVEKTGELGGHLRHIKHLFEGEEDPQGHLERLVKEVEASGDITVHLGTTLEGLEGVPGMFTSRVKGPDGEKELRHGAVIVATGGVEYEPTEFLYGKSDRVMTQSQLEGMIADGKLPDGLGSVVMVQCVGSRGDDFPNCSRICCTVAVKNALKLLEVAPGVEVRVLFRDMRTYGFVEDRFREARNKGVHFIRYSKDNLPEVVEDGGRVKVTLDDAILGRRVSMGADLLVLSAGIRPNPDNEGLAKRLRVAISKDHFFLEGHVKMRPVDFSSEGIFVCGLAQGPRSVSESVAQALAAASRASRLLSRDHVMGEVIIASVDPAKCRGCGRCELACEFAAIRVVTETIGEVERMVSKVDEAKCKGCGRCSVVCCNKSISMKNYGTGQMERIIEAALEE